MTNDEASQFEPIVIVYPLKKLEVYQISGDQLKALERGSPDSPIFNFSIFFLGSCISLIIALATCSFESDRKFYVFVILALGCGITCIILFLLWIFKRKGETSVIDEIKMTKPVTGNL